MIKTEYLNDGTLIKHYSDAGFLLLQNETGAKYSDPIDIVPCPYTYTETDEPIEKSEEPEYSSEIEEKAAAYDILVGVSE
jgi:hypothetical protein